MKLTKAAICTLLPKPRAKTHTTKHYTHAKYLYLPTQVMSLLHNMHIDFTQLHLTLYGFCSFVIKELSIWTMMHLKRFTATMLPLTRIKLAMILVVAVQCVEGNQKIVHVSELISDNDDFFTNASGEDDSSHVCCVYGNCSCNSLQLALAHLTGNVLINITTDVMLSSLIKTSHLENVSIIGHNYPTVNCTSGGIHFTFCHNCVIQGITWDGCGNNINSHIEPGVKLYNISNVTIQNCSFLHSVGQAVVLSEISGDVNIYNCKFTNNSNYNSYGAALHYLSINAKNCVLTINNCSFTNNSHSTSLVYIENKSFYYHKIIFNNSIFCNNQGISVYVINHRIYLSGQLLFQNNTAENGAGIYISDYSTVVFDKTSNVTFIQNSAKESGGAIFLKKYSFCIFDLNSEIKFYYNEATRGSTIYSEVNSNVTFKASCNVLFNSNLAITYGAAIYTFKIGYISFEENSTAEFSNNTAYLGGGAIASYHYCSISFEGSSVTMFIDNFAYLGGVIDSYNSSHISFKGNSTAEFDYNYANEDGVIYSYANSYITFEGNSTTKFINNLAIKFGPCGTICSKNSYISFLGNSTAVFSNNTANNGGVICSYNSSLSFEENSLTVFSNNHNPHGSKGGVIHSENNCYISFKGNSITMFSNNTAGFGGAIYSENNCHISFKENSTTVFANNIVYNSGTVYAENNCHISFEENSTTVFSNNTAEYGGAMMANYQCGITFDNNAAVFFNNNTAKTRGATIYSTHDPEVTAKGNFSVTFNNLPARWCSNICLPYSGGSDAVIVDSNGIVWCNNPNTFNLTSNKYYCRNLRDILASAKDNQLINITDKVLVLSSVIKLNNSNNISIIGHNNPTIFCINDSGLKMEYCNNLSIDGITWIGCGTTDTVDVNYKYVKYRKDIPATALALTSFSNLTLQKCSFHYSKGQAADLVNASGYVSINDCKFMNNNQNGRKGAVIYYTSQYHQFDVFTINKCDFISNIGTILFIFIQLYKQHTITSLINSSFYNNEGTCIQLEGNCKLQISGEVLFQSNKAENAAGMYIHQCTVIFSISSNVKFINNSVNHNGAAVFLIRKSRVLFDNNSVVTFSDNKATNGTIYSVDSNVVFKATCEVTFINNLATQYGAAIYSYDNSHVIVTGNAKTNFINNVIISNDTGIHLQLGGTISSENNGYISFEENSITVFNNNFADLGAAIFSINNSNVIFKGNSTVTFSDNTAHFCGILASTLFSSITFTDNTKVIYSTNTVSYTLVSNHESFGGTICTFKSKIVFSGHSLVALINNKANKGGGVIFVESNVTIDESSSVTFSNNLALYSSGGALVCSNNSNVTIKGNSNVTFSSNKASQNGGAIHSYNMCRITVKDNSTSTFTNNTARNNGGAILAIGSQPSELTFEGTSEVYFDGNMADNGGVFYCTNFTISFNGSSMISFYSNKARQTGGVGYYNLNSQIIFTGNTTVTFDNNIAEQIAGVLYSTWSKIIFKENSTVKANNNKATLKGGALYFDNNSDVLFTEFTNITIHNNRALHGGAVLVNEYSNVTVTGKSIIFFVSNEASQSGGAAYFNYNCNFIIKENATVTFDVNKALHGGAVGIGNKTKFIIEENSIVYFCNNLGTVGGGAIKVSDSRITLKDYVTFKFTNNNAVYGGAILLDTTGVMVNNSFNKHCINFTNNIAKISGNSVYQDTDEFCNANCLSDRLVGISIEFVNTPPNVLKFYDPAICIDNDNNTQCHNYYLQDIMLGTHIAIPACVLDYYNQTIDFTQFLIHTETHPNLFITGPKQVLISHKSFEGISIMGNQTLLKSTNISINITLNVAVNSNWKQLLVNLIIELSPCHPGFWQYPNSVKCECYNASDIVFCSGSSSTIKRGYWYGSVTGKPTVTFCPNNYCNFTCCETSNGYYHLSPVRDNQCRSHRSGIACGRCDEGYTLSFDSVECIHMKECSIAQKILLFASIVLYWTIIIVTVFSLMHFRVGIGYLYAITFYYSVVDILLIQNWYHSNAPIVIINVMSSIAKITPQFLGQLCFIANMSGIDQQFIHYIHPVAISLFLVMITVLARRSHRLSFFISKGIIHVICCLLLLSYTSLATTSLLLMRPLIFHDVNKVYTYVSPDVEYFHGRHLVYAVVAMIFTTVIVIGLPLLLALEPFLNSKINFVKVKPLLDQFQGSYKDNYRCFAGYYMICRLIIITIVIANPSNDFIFQYLLLIACVIMALIHQIFRPYSNSVLNMFDGAIFHFLIVVSVFPLAEFYNNFDSKLVVGITFILVIFPALIFITMSLMINKEKLKKLPGYCYFKCSQLYLKHHNEIPLNDIEESNEYIDVIDDSRRINAMICDA